ncbi:hypothetical protein CK203_084493 [Vitis vinifera]|uniref:Uncharacterized protein n=1 Tax=Vitis vinifera TaxID=29760 RepID=A0A438EG82_VITVI|nr:hypothetical protein CK203_084493 [Vitis vinifera]
MFISNQILLFLSTGLHQIAIARRLDSCHAPPLCLETCSLSVYVSLMFAAKLWYDGSEILVEVASLEFLVGFFYLCSARFLMLLSALVSAGIGLLTGSTAMLLMLLGDPSS